MKAGADRSSRGLQIPRRRGVRRVSKPSVGVHPAGGLVLDREVQERRFAPVLGSRARRRATSSEASPRPRCPRSVQTALISVNPGGCRRSPAIATSSLAVADAEIRAELDGAGRERPGPGALDQRQHLGHVGRSEPDEACDGSSASSSVGHVVGQPHLAARCTGTASVHVSANVYDRGARRNAEPPGPTSPRSVVPRLRRSRRRRGAANTATSGRYLAAGPARSATVACGPGECMPNGIVEHVHARDPGTGGRRHRREFGTDGSRPARRSRSAP